MQALACGTRKPERYTLIATTQGVAVVRKLLAEGVFKVPLSKIRVLTYDVGGGFGMKAQTYPEYGAILYAARKTGRPVKWCNSRVESFLSDSHGRDGILEGDMAFDAQGNILALRVRNLVGIGPYTTQYAAIFGTANTKNCLSSVYRIPAIQIDVKLVFTNAAPLGPYRGAGRPEAIYLIERLFDGAARKLGIDRVSLRRRNFIPPSAMPYQTAIGPIYDSGEFEALDGQGAANCRTGPDFPIGAPHRTRPDCCAELACAAFSRLPAAFSTRRRICASRPDGTAADTAWRAGDGAGSSYDASAR